MRDRVRMDVYASPVAGAEGLAWAQVPAGRTLLQMLGKNVNLSRVDSIAVGGQDVPESLWRVVRPKAGQRVEVRCRPKLNGTAGMILRFVAIAVISYYAPGAGSSLAAGNSALAGVYTAGIIVASSIAINALIPPPGVSTSGASSPEDQLRSLTGTSNQIAPGSPIPMVLGAPTWYPPHAAQPYTEILGNDQWLLMMLDLGHDAMDHSDIKIGDTALADYDNVQWEITKTPTLFTQDVNELAVGTTLDNVEDSDTRTSQDDSRWLSVDLLFSQGLGGYNSKNKPVSAWVYVDITFRKAGTATWYGTQDSSPQVSSTAIQLWNLSVYRVKANQPGSAVRVGVRWQVPSDGQYEVMVRRSSEGYDSSVQVVNSMTWSVLRSIAPRSPSNTGTTKLVMRIKATDQLTGVVSSVNLRSARLLPTYNATTGVWSDPVETTNPAWHYWWLMTAATGVPRLLPASRVSLAAITAWAAVCDAKALSISHVVDTQMTQGDLLRQVAACGRAHYGMEDNLHSVVQDVLHSTPTQVITPANSSNFQYVRNHVSPPHALKVSFTNPEAGFQQDSFICYWDGYTAANATLFEELDLSWVDSYVAAWRLARYYLAGAWLRPVTYTCTMDIEHLVAKRGGLVYAAHPAMGVGLYSGRIKSVVGNRIVLDGPVKLDAAKSYMLRVRRHDASIVAGLPSPVVTFDTDVISWDNGADWDDLTAPTNVLTLTDVTDIRKGDLYLLGESITEKIPLVLKGIKPGDNLSAELALVDQALDLYTKDAGTPPIFVSQLNNRAWEQPPPPPNITIRIGTTPANDAGLVGLDTGVSVTQASGIYRLPYYKQQLAVM